MSYEYIILKFLVSKDKFHYNTNTRQIHIIDTSVSVQILSLEKNYI